MHYLDQLKTGQGGYARDLLGVDCTDGTLREAINDGCVQGGFSFIEPRACRLQLPEHREES